MQTAHANHPSVKMYAAFDRGDWPAVLELVSPSVRAYVASQQYDRDGWRAMGEMFRAAFPDCRHELRSVHVDGEYATTIATFRGTHKGDFMGIAATGRPVAFEVIHVDRVVDGRIVEHRGQFDSAGLLQQLTGGTTADALPLVREMFRRIDSKDFDGALALATPDLTFRFGAQTMNAAGWRGFSSDFFAGVPDGKHEFSELFATGERVVGIGTFSGTHRGPLMGVPASGRRIAVSYIVVLCIRDGRVRDVAVEADIAGMLQQISG